MLGWIFKKKRKEGLASAVIAASPVASASAPEVDWTAALAQAHGDDEALLSLARTARAPLPFKQAAVQALSSEEALRLAEREFRSHDRRVHQLAKKHLQEKVAQRQTRERAAHLIESARGLIGAAPPAANRLVELDRAWNALEASEIAASQHDEFTGLLAQLTTELRRRGDIERLHKGWQAQAAGALRQLQAVCAEAAAGSRDREELGAAMRAAHAVVSAPPPQDETVPASVQALADLQQGLEVAQMLDSRLAVMDRLLAESSESTSAAAPDRTVEPDAAEDSSDAEAAGVVSADGDPETLPASVDDPQRQWQELPPLPDAHWASLLQARHARWQEARNQARLARPSQREQPHAGQRALQSEQLTVLADGLAQAEAALDAGQLDDAHRHLGRVDERLQGADAPVALRIRIAAAQARLAQLRGWQHWAGGRAREELVLQAEALAAATVGSADSSEDGQVDGSGGLVADVARLSIRQRTEVIETLRKRWKELDGSGGSGGRALWLRFDAALTTAGAPVSAHFAAQRAAREANLAARQQLLDALEAAGAAGTNGSAGEAPDGARGVALTLDRFHAEWRKLGPLEHTVPRAARAALVERMAAAVHQLKASLHAARVQAGAERQALVARARALAHEEAGRGRDMVASARALQAEWRQHAKALPLARAEEQALWSEFKAAIDAAFAARKAVQTARDVEFEANAAERSALIERLRLPAGDTPAARRRMLAEVDAAWERCGPAPRDRAAAIDAEFRAAREALLWSLEASAQRAWDATCDALEAKLALCLAREQGTADLDAAAMAASWQGLPVLPAPFEDVLRRRAGLAPAADAGAASDVDDRLLAIEMAWDLPTPPALEPARRQRKFLALKQSLEGRRSAAPQTTTPEAALASLLSCPSLNAGQRDRLGAVLAAWRLRGPRGRHERSSHD